MPKEPQVLSALAVAQEAAGSASQAIETLDGLAKLQPNSPQPLQQLAALHIRSKEYARAVEVLLRAQQVAPGERSVSANLVQAHVVAGKFDEAIKVAKALQSVEPKYAGGYALEGEVYAAQQMWLQAERAQREALKVEPQNGRVATQLYRVLVAAGKVNDADAFSRKWIAEHRRDTAMRLYLAERALTDGSHGAAFKLYREVIAVDPNNAVALNNLAYVAGQLGDGQAIGYAERAVRLAPNNASMLDTLGMLLVKKGDVSRGFEYLDRARVLAPDAPVLRLNFARALVIAGRKTEARRELEALKAMPEVFRGKEEIDKMLRSL